MSIKIIIVGVNGKMGREVAKMILANSPKFELVCGVSPTFVGKTVGDVLGQADLDIPCVASLQDALSIRADVVVDFTTPYVVKHHIDLAIKAGVRSVVGTSGLSEVEIEELSQKCSDSRTGCILAPNFAIGAVLMMMFSAKAAQYLPHVEIIELHHDKKLDAPSGTAVKTAELISAARNNIDIQNYRSNAETELLQGARGAKHQGFHIHSVRLPGLVAHQEVLLGGENQLLAIKHESFSRESFMPGVKLAIEHVMTLDHLVYGLDKIIKL